VLSVVRVTDAGCITMLGMLCLFRMGGMTPERPQGVRCDAAQAGGLGKAHVGPCGRSGDHPAGRFCLAAAARCADSTGRQPAFIVATPICGQAAPVTPMWNRQSIPKCNAPAR